MKAIRRALRRATRAWPNFDALVTFGVNWVRLRTGQLTSSEPEFQYLSNWLQEGDTAIDVGANMGVYSLAMSRLVGDAGRVIAVEPIPRSFTLLVALVSSSGARNVTFLNLAATDECREVGFSIPESEPGIANYWRTKIDAAGSQRGLAYPLDRLDGAFLDRLRFIKIDVEGHESAVVRGMAKLIEGHRPVVLAEGRDEEVKRWVQDRG